MKTIKSYQIVLFSSKPYRELLFSLQIAEKINSDKDILEKISAIRSSMKAVVNNHSMYAALAHNRGSIKESEFYISKAFNKLGDYHTCVVDNFIRLGFLKREQAVKIFLLKNLENLKDKR